MVNKTEWDFIPKNAAQEIIAADGEGTKITL